MRNKKSNILYYVVAAVLVLIAVGVVMLEVPLKQEQVEIVLK